MRNATGSTATAVLLVGLLCLTLFVVSAAPVVSDGGGSPGIEATASEFPVDADRTKTNRGNVRCLAYSPDGRFLLTCLGEHNAKIWQLTDSNPTEKLRIDHGGFLVGAAFSPDGSLVVTFGVEEGLKLWNAEDGSLVGSFTEARLEGATFTPDGQFLVAGDTRETVYKKDAKLWFFDGTTGKLIREVDAGQTSTGAVIVIDQGRNIVHTDPASSTNVVVRDFWKGTVLKTLKGHAAGAYVQASLDGSFFTSVARHFQKPQEVFVWDSESLKRVLSLEFPHEDGWLPKTAALSVDNEYLFVLVDRKTESLKQTSRLQVYQRSSGALLGWSAELDAEGTAIAVSPNGKAVAVGGRRFVERGNLEGMVFLFESAALLGK